MLDFLNAAVVMMREPHAKRVKFTRLKILPANKKPPANFFAGGLRELVLLHFRAFEEALQVAHARRVTQLA